VTAALVLATCLALYWTSLFLRIFFALGGSDPLPELPPLVNDGGARPRVSVLVAVRNETDRILRESIESLLAQDYPSFEVIAVDDHSEDDSVRVMKVLSAEDPRLQVREAPEEARGKREALAHAAKSADGEWFLFTDADATLRPDALARGIELSCLERIDGLSLLPKTVTVSFWEQAALAASGWLVYEGGALRRCNEENAPVGLAAAGPYLLVRAEAYRAVGGYEALGQNVLLDSALATNLRAHGFRYRYLASGGAVETRMYRSLGEVFMGFGKNAFAAVGNRLHLALPAALLVVMLVSSPLPLVILMALAGRFTAFALSTVALVAMMKVQSRGGRFMGTDLRALALLGSGLGGLLWAAILIHSIVASRSSRGVFWKGRYVPVYESPRGRTRGSSSFIQRNFWEITDECWNAIESRLEPGMRTLETGSGKSTILFERAGCDHVALEHDVRKRAPYTSVVVAPLTGSPAWYDWEPAHPFDLVLIDGPPGRIGRFGILRVLPRLVHRGSVIVVDDTHRKAERRLAEEIARRHGMSVESRKTTVFGLVRGYSILSPPGRPPRHGE
jgi:glycosyltransferase involved in cell wall biosynthesis